MPRKPSQANLLKYDVEAFINRKVELLHMFDTQSAILSLHKEEYRRVREELKQKYTCLEGSVPSNPEHAKKYLENCEALADSPATTTEQRIKKAGAALTLAVHTIKEEKGFPRHVQLYVMHEYMTRLHALRGRTPGGKDALPNTGCRVVDELTMVSLLKNPVAIERKTFILTGDGPEDTETFRVVGSGRSNQEAFWEALYDGTKTQ